MMVDKKRDNGHRDEDPLRDFSDIVEQMLNKLGLDLDDITNEPFIYGFSVTNCSGEDPEIREYGNLPDKFDFGHESYPNDPIQINESRPLIDVVEIEDRIYVTAEVSGVEKEDISLSVTDTFIELNAFHGKNRYSETIVLPARTDPGSARASYRNGVLEIVLKKVAESLRFDVAVE
jgi:HSP20 family protein